MKLAPGAKSISPLCHKRIEEAYINKRDVSEMAIAKACVPVKRPQPQTPQPLAPLPDKQKTSRTQRRREVRKSVSNFRSERRNQRSQSIGSLESAISDKDSSHVHSRNHTPTDDDFDLRGSVSECFVPTWTIAVASSQAKVEKLLHTEKFHGSRRLVERAKSTGSLCTKNRSSDERLEQVWMKARSEDPISDPIPPLNFDSSKPLKANGCTNEITHQLSLHGNKKFITCPTNEHFETLNCNESKVFCRDQSSATTSLGKSRSRRNLGYDELAAASTHSLPKKGRVRDGRRKQQIMNSSSHNLGEIDRNISSWENFPSSSFLPPPPNVLAAEEAPRNLGKITSENVPVCENGRKTTCTPPAKQLKSNRDEDLDDDDEDDHDRRKLLSKSSHSSRSFRRIVKSVLIASV